MAADVRLVDLDVVKRYSLAVRREMAPAEEVLAALDASREHVLAAIEANGNGAVNGSGNGRARRTRRSKAQT